MSKDKIDISSWAECHGEVIWIDDIPWNLRNRILEPLSMPHTIKNVDQKKVQKALSDTNALLALWSDQWDMEESEWWWTCCDDKKYNIEKIKNMQGKRGVKKGSGICSIRRIDAKDFPDLTHSLYTISLKSYGLKDTQIPSLEEYRRMILKFSKYNGYELWGSFIKDQLAAFAICILIDNAVSFGSTKSDPAMHKFYPNNAMFYQITKHYLCERGVSYITNGHRTLLHPTTINDFLIRMGYRKVFCRLNIKLSNYTKLILSSGIDNWGSYLNLGKIFPDQWEKLQGLSKLVKISKTFN
jgi:hypothetical protein